MTTFITSASELFGMPLNLFADNSLYLAPEDYPNQVWGEQTAQYNRWWTYYKGYDLNEKNARNTELYPVKLNLVRPAVHNHAAILLGQYTDEGVIKFGIRSTTDLEDSTKEKLIKILTKLWSVNQGDELIMSAAIMQQVFGGSFFKVAWQPTRKKYPIRYFNYDPRACFPVWDADDYDRLVSIDVHHQVPRPTAAIRYRVLAQASIKAEASPEYVNVHEHWDEGEYFIKVNEEIAKWPDGSEMAGPNPFIDPVLGLPLIPYIYAPRLRVGEFYGESMVPSMIGAQREINNNMAHLNEGVADAMHQQPWVRNRAKGTQGLMRPRDEFIDLGMGQQGSGDPELGRMEGAKIDQAIVDYATDSLTKIARESNNMPDVAYGKTDASIRSALTLKYMMWPAMNVGFHYRKNMAAALKRLNYTALVVANVMGSAVSKFADSPTVLGIESVTPDMIEAVLVDHRTYFPPMLPDDRAELVNEAVQRISAQIISRKTAIRMLDGEDNLEAELALIQEEIDAQHELEQENLETQHAQALELTKAKGSQAGSGQSAPGGTPAKPKPKDQTTKAQAAGGRSSSK